MQYQTLVTSSIGVISQTNLKPKKQVVEIKILNSYRFNVEEWSDDSFAVFKRRGNTIKVYLSGNPYVSGRLFGVILRDPLGEFEDTYLGLEQEGQPFMFTDEDHTGVRGVQDLKKQVELPNPFLRVYKSGKVMTETETQKVELKVYGGEGRAYIRGIERYRICGTDEAGKPINQVVKYDKGITATLSFGDEMIEEDNKEYRVNTLSVASNGRPFSDNDDYFYVITLGHYNNPRYYTEVVAKYKSKDAGANGHADVNANDIIFYSAGGEHEVAIDFKNDEDGDWTVQLADDTVDWLRIEEYPTSIKVVCSPIQSIDENDEISSKPNKQRSTVINFNINGKSRPVNIFQEASQKLEVRIGDILESTQDDGLVVFPAVKPLPKTVSVVSYGRRINKFTPTNAAMLEKMEVDSFENGLVCSYDVKITVKPNNATSDRSCDINLETDKTVSSKPKIVIEQKGMNKSVVPVKCTVTGSTAQIDTIVQVDSSMDLVTAYSSATWCEVEMTVKKGYYEASFKVKDTEPNVFGTDRKSKVIFTNANDMSKTDYCIITNPSTGDGLGIKVSKV